MTISTIFDKRFYLRENFVKKQLYIDDSLYLELVGLSKIYKADISDLMNVCIESMTDNFDLSYLKNKDEVSFYHTVLIRRDNVDLLEKYKESYGISISRLMNIAIANILHTNIAARK